MNSENVSDSTFRPLIIVTDRGGFITLHEPNEDGAAGDLVASVWREDWLPRLLAPEVCDGLAVINKNELQRLTDEREKFMWQVRDTCARAEKAEAALVSGV